MIFLIFSIFMWWQFFYRLFFKTFSEFFLSFFFKRFFQLFLSIFFQNICSIFFHVFFFKDFSKFYSLDLRRRISMCRWSQRRSCIFFRRIKFFFDCFQKIYFTFFYRFFFFKRYFKFHSKDFITQIERIKGKKSFEKKHR